MSNYNIFFRMMIEREGIISILEKSTSKFRLENLRKKYETGDFFSVVSYVGWQNFLFYIGYRSFFAEEWKRFPSLSQEKKKLNKVHGKVKNEGEFSYKESCPFLFEKNIKNFSRERVGIFHILWNNIL